MTRKMAAARGLDSGERVPRFLFSVFRLSVWITPAVAGLFDVLLGA